MYKAIPILLLLTVACASTPPPEAAPPPQPTSSFIRLAPGARVDISEYDVETGQKLRDYAVSPAPAAVDVAEVEPLPVDQPEPEEEKPGFMDRLAKWGPLIAVTLGQALPYIIGAF